MRFEEKKSARRPKKGESMSFTFSSYADLLHKGPTWCPGEAGVLVTMAKKRTEDPRRAR
ncbi:MAG TPA: hypothetical protein VGM33_16700 [Baekduia sp.]